MILSGVSSHISDIVYQYRTHIFVFLIAFFIGLTVAHPAVLLNDEFITTNQIRQLHVGHQIIINEGKFGLRENGSMSTYFAYKSNLLGYPIFYPLVSLPAYWAIDLSGENFVYLILCLWTLIALVILLMIDRYYMAFSYFRKRRWTPFAFAAVFIIFFVNLFFYTTFPVDSVENHPEVMALVFTNMILLSIAAVLTYESFRTIFEDPAYSFFSTIACLFSSSFFLWATHCKDHILVLPIITAVLLCMIRLVKTGDSWYLPLAFIFTGLLAWARPEIAPWIFVVVSVMCLYSLKNWKERQGPRKDLTLLLCSPFFTLIGALPFFLNNYLITKNVFLPVQSIYLSTQPAIETINTTPHLVPATGIHSVELVFLRFIPTVSSPQEFLTDFSGILFYPANGAVSITTIIPLLVVMATLACIYLVTKKIRFSSDEKRYIGVCMLLCFSIFLAYLSTMHILNTDYGIVPDIRYFSSLYIPLMMVALIILRKINIIPEKTQELLPWMIVLCISGAIISLVLLPAVYGPAALKSGKIPIGNFFSLYILALCVLITGTILIRNVLFIRREILQYLVLLLCTVPFFWQVNAILIARSFSGFAGYTFWIPVVRVGWEVIVNFILLKSALP